jgi:anhydro-N-acetylmuramic acid kinase
MKSKFNAIGLMSGTSMDGLDIAYCSFKNNNQSWNFNIIQAETIKYPPKLLKSLSIAHKMDALTFWKLHVEFGRFCGNVIKKFIFKHKCKPQLIASHGHTIFHQPQNGFTCQIGDGSQIAAITGINTVCDFRSKDIALKGQGAPLVPIGDHFLFPKVDACLNIGGIANISFKLNNKMIAFDVSPANMVFNHYANLKGKKMDKNGQIAKKGSINYPLFNKLNQLHYYKSNSPRSLGREWVFEKIISLADKYEISIEDKLRTNVEHSAFQIAEIINKNKLKRVLISGGGAYNQFFVERIQNYTKAELYIPDSKIVEFKEALVFAFLGVLRTLEKDNCLKSVTGADNNNCGGAIYLGV